MNPYVFQNKGHQVYFVHLRGLTVRQVNAGPFIHICGSQRPKGWILLIDGTKIDGLFPTRQAAAEAALGG